MTMPSLALDLMLKAFLNDEAEATGDDYKDRSRMMSVMSRIVPGTSAYKCERRLEELRRELQTKSIRLKEASLSKPDRIADEKRSDESFESKGSSNKKTDKSQKISDSGSNIELASLAASDYGPTMVIHVYDETKKVKRDFTCPHDLLLSQMKYFSSYLTTDSAQTLDDVDISVHCDVDIFDWLLRYVKKSLSGQDKTVKLEPTNVISILISSDFLRMDSLVEECVSYCHDKLNEILATPCNMNCIEERLVSRIAQSFNASELDGVEDKKDKFKNKLFGKKVEDLLRKLYGPAESDSSIKIFRCSACKRILTNKFHRNIQCLPNRLTTDNTGNLAHRHTVDTTFDINTFLIELKNDRPWSEIYWILWSLLSTLTCSACGQLFQCSDLSTCRYHPQMAVYERGDQLTPGFYPCCGQTTLRFDPSATNMGCRMKDHVCDAKVSSDNKSSTNGKTSDTAQSKQIYQELLSHRDIICFSQKQLVTKVSASSKQEQLPMSIFTNVESTAETNEELSSCFAKNYKKIMSKVGDKTLTSSVHDVPPDDKYDDRSDDDEEEGVDCDNRVVQRKSVRAVNTDSATATSYTTATKVGKLGEWDSSRSVRYNQDSQREADQRRMKEIVNYLSSHQQGSNRTDRAKQRDYAGGLFSRLEVQWKQANTTFTKPLNLPLSRSKSRLGLQAVK